MSNIRRLAIIAICLALVTNVFASTADQTADRVLGQASLTDNTPNFGGPSALNGPMGVAVDARGHLYVVDNGNTRVLGFADAASFVNGAPADLVIGQPDFFKDAAGYPILTPSSLNSPIGVATDTDGNLYVADFIDNRVLEYQAPFDSGYTAEEPASIIFGNTTSSSNLTGCQIGQPAPDADNLCGPTAVASDAQGNIYVTDSGYNRVLVYLKPTSLGGGTPGSPGAAGDTTADMVFGQANSFARFLPCTTSPQPISASSLCINFGGIGGLAVDRNGDLFVADINNMRVLKFDTPLNSASGEPGAGDTVADLVIGQADLNTAAPCSNRRRASSSVLCDPVGVSIDPDGNLFVADAERVLEFDSPAASGPRARRVFGQKDFTSDFCGAASAKCLGTPMLPANDAAGRLYVPDYQNNRVLAYDTPLASSTATRILGQIDFAHNDVNFPTGRSLSSPLAATVDPVGHLYLADTNRILGWKSATGFNNGDPADLVIGQPDFYSTTCHLLGPPAGCAVCGVRKRKAQPKPDRSSPMMCSPQGVATDKHGNLFVSDTDNNRVMIFASPFDACAGKFPCIGAPLMAIIDGKRDRSSCIKPSANSLCGPEQLALDPSGNLWLADSGNSRALLFKNPIAVAKNPSQKNRIIATAAELVIGQGSSGTQFTTRKCDDGNLSNPTLGADTLCYPDGIALDTTNNLYVSDSGNGRILEYDNPLAQQPGTPGKPGSAGDVTADRAFDAGGSFTLRDCRSTADQLCVPAQLAVDPQNNLYSTDLNRVLEFLNPTAAGGGDPGVPGSSGDTTADVVFGQQGDFTAGSCNGNDISTLVNAATLCQPQGVTVDSAASVYIADTANHRILAFTHQ